MSPTWGEWSDWVWDPSQARFWRARQDTQGHLEYDFEQRAPRGNSDDVTESFSNLSLGGQDAFYTQGNAYTHNAPVAAGGAATSSMYSTSATQSQAAVPGKSKGKSRAHRESHKDKGPSKKHRSKSSKSPGDDHHEGPFQGNLPPFYSHPRPASDAEQVSTSSATSTPQPAFAEPAYGSSSVNPTYAPDRSQSTGVDRGYNQGYDQGYGQGYGQSYGQGYGQASPTHADAEAQSIDPGLYTRRGHASDSGTSSQGFAAAENQPSEEQGSSYYTSSPDSPDQEGSSTSTQLQDVISQSDPYMTGAVGGSDYSTGEIPSMATTQSYSYSAQGADSGRETPRPFAQQSAAMMAPEDYQYQVNPAPRYGSGPEGDMHDGYVVERSSRFRPGEIFKILWCEPLGAGAPKSEVITHHVRLEHNGRHFYQGLRRFIVIANDEGHCTCVPILTYERKACNKRGVKPLKHGIIYQAGKSPRMLAGEPKLGFDPVRVNLYEKAEQLVDESRVNYAKLTTIEHNFRVFFIGSVHPSDFHNIVMPAIDTCWERKRRHNNY